MSKSKENREEQIQKVEQDQLSRAKIKEASDLFDYSSDDAAIRSVYHFCDQIQGIINTYDASIIDAVFAGQLEKATSINNFLCFELRCYIEAGIAAAPDLDRVSHLASSQLLGIVARTDERREKFQRRHFERKEVKKK